MSSYPNLKARLRDERAVGLRAEGYTYAQIAEKLGYSSPRACSGAIQRQLERSAKTFGRDREYLAMLEEERLRKAEKKLWDKADEVDPTKLVDSVTKLHDRRVNLHGIGAKFEVEADKAEALAVLSSALYRAIAATGLPEEEQETLLTQIAGELGMGDE